MVVKDTVLALERGQETIYDEVQSGKFRSHPKDVMVIRHTSGMVTDTISVELFPFYSGHVPKSMWFALKNCLGAWEWLKNISEIHARFVLYQTDDNPETIFYDESAPYKCRFGQLDPTKPTRHGRIYPDDDGETWTDWYLFQKLTDDQIEQAIDQYGLYAGSNGPGCVYGCDPVVKTVGNRTLITQNCGLDI
jgi:hypothetical protein